MNHRVTQIRSLTENTFVLRFERGDMQFRAGQRITVGITGDMNLREYSIYSGENDNFLEILVREVSGGSVSTRLKQCKPGLELNVDGPFGAFGIEPYDRYSKKLVFIATGTGISPFHSIVRSYPGLNYSILHGVRFNSEAYDSNEYESARYILCTSKETHAGFKGRVTRYLLKYKISSDMLFYLCGNGSMIYEVYHILLDKGIPDEKIFSEIYF
jgi:ferredoxin/flavodoxin---NADP+ reductase